jgi:hypothetical protein
MIQNKANAFIGTFIFLLFFQCAHILAGSHSEAWYQEKWCSQNNGQSEVVLSDKTRCDCLTDDYAIEFDFARKWYQAIGQSMHYSCVTGKLPGIILILEKPKDKRYLNRLIKVIECRELNLKVWTISP